MTHGVRPAALALAFVAAGCTAELGATGADPDTASDDVCVAAPCHGSVAKAMEHGSSHAVLLRCRDCHEVLRLDASPGHARTAHCSDCHSQRVHGGAGCDVCHAPHGTSNAFLLRETLAVDEDRIAIVRVVRPEGASWSGLARAGVPGAKAGTGVCEVCHDATRFYDRAGAGEPHDSAWCGGCHLHDLGFLTPPEE